MRSLPAEGVRVAAIWEDFVCGGNDKLDGLRPIVRESWLRCRRTGVDQWKKNAPVALSPVQVLATAKELPWFPPAARVASVLAEAIKGTVASVTLADAQARVILQLYGTAKAREELERINGVEGSQWIEAEVGADALPTALFLDKPLQISWYEHYLQVVHNWAGSAAPIHESFTGKILGAVSVYGYLGALDPGKSLAIVEQAANLIERELALEESLRQSVIRERYEEEVHRLDHDAVIALSANGAVVKVSPSALAILGYSSISATSRYPHIAEHLGISASLLALDSWRRTPEIDIYAKDGEQMKARVLPVTNESQLAGLILVLSPRRRSQARTLTPWAARYTFADIIGRTDVIVDSISRAQKLAQREVPVLIVGESGTGKELFAHAIHAASARRNGPFVPLNCGAVSEELLSAELFGYSDGAFTGAIRGGRPGRLELAHQGTLFLDEVDAMSPRMQVHFLRIIEDKLITRVGGEKPRLVDVRVIAATNTDLEKRIKNGSFRQDLYYRLRGAELSVPPLRERKDDIPVLGDYFLRSSNRISHDALVTLQAYDWPGNVRQLKYVLEEAQQSAGEFITERDLPATICTASRETAGNSVTSPLLQCYTSEKRSTESERDTIVRVLTECNGSLSKAAAKLNLHRATLYRKIRKHGIWCLFR